MCGNKNGAQAKVEIRSEQCDQEQIEGFSVEENACKESETSRSCRLGVKSSSLVSPNREKKIYE